jgi:hypothetical protein
MADIDQAEQIKLDHEYAYLHEPTTIGPNGSGVPAVASFFASASM